MCLKALQLEEKNPNSLTNRQDEDCCCHPLPSPSSSRQRGPQPRQKRDVQRIQQRWPRALQKQSVF